MAISYALPDHWGKFDAVAVAPALTAAKAAVLSLTLIPYQRSWAEKLQTIQLKREVAGTSRIEGADFTDVELELAMTKQPGELHTRSQRQAAAAVKAYRWIAMLPIDYPITRETILEIHRLIVTDADDDHCPPGVLRGPDQNVTFGSPRHRGVQGGDECAAAFDRFCDELDGQMRTTDILVRALAAHYHFAAMHPFLDGNGRTARALEALFLQRCGLRDTLFIAMSNYYYEEKQAYLQALSDVRTQQHDLTPFLIFGLRGIEIQCLRLLEEIRVNLSKALYRNQMYDLFNRLKSTRKRVIAERQIKILSMLLEQSETVDKLEEAMFPFYTSLKNPAKAWVRDVDSLLSLRAIGGRQTESGGIELFARLEWPTEITETEFFRIVNAMPKAKTHRFLDH
ncbi:MAG: Fic family protein [Candidatus Hydrogenedentes bacterium]|nr:Fic family protein [Candidatus Hydrogenedentota bacterium]